MHELSLLRLHVLRGMYLFIAIGLGFAIWPDIIAPPSLAADVKTVTRSLLGAVALLALLGVRYPVKMLPVLFFELVWKLIWVSAFALPMWLGPGLDDKSAYTLFECALGLVLLPLVIPWRHVYREYVVGSAERWR